MRVLVVLHGMPPQAGRTVVGSGLRAFANGEGLRAAGHEVLYCTRIEDLPAELKSAAEAERIRDAATLALDGPSEAPGDPARKRRRGKDAAAEADAPASESPAPTQASLWAEGSTPTSLAPVGGPPGSPGNPLAFTEPHELRRVVASVAPDVILVEALEETRHLPPGEHAVILDLFAPRVLEQQFQADSDEREAVRVLDAIQAADHFVFSNERQRIFHLPLLAMAGVDCTRDAGVVVPISCPPELPTAAQPKEPVFVAGGVFWPWADISSGLSVLFSTLKARKRGRLHLYGGEYGIRSDTQRYADPRAVLPKKHEQLTFRGLVPIDELWSEYASASVAFDLMAPNPERAINLSFRQIDYLRCGLPLITAPGQVIAEDVAAYGAGWLVEPGDEAALTALVEQLLDEPERIANASAAAQRLAAEKYAWTRTTAPLDALVRKPRRRQHRETVVGRVMRTQGDLWEEVERGKRLRELVEAQIGDLGKKEEEVQRQDAKIRQLLGTVDRLTGSLDSVSKFKNEALAYLSETEDKALTEAAELARELERKKLDLHKRDDALKAADREITKLKASLAELNEDHLRLQEKYLAADAGAQRATEADERAAALRLDLAKKDRELQEAQARREADVADLQARLEQALGKADAAAAQRDAQAGTLSEVRAQASSLEADLGKKEAEADALREQLELVRDQGRVALQAKDREIERLAERASREATRVQRELERQLDAGLAQLEVSEAKATDVVSDLRGRLGRLQEERARLQARLAEAQHRVRDLERSAQAKEDELSEQRKAARLESGKAEAQHRRAVDALEDDLREARRQLEEAKVDGAQLREQVGRLKGRIADLGLDVDKKTAALTEAGKEREHLEARMLAALQQTEGASKDLLAAARARVEALEPAGRRLPELEAKLRDLESDVARKDAARTEALAGRDRIEEEALAALTRAQEQSQSLLRSTRARLEEVQADRARLQAKLDELASERASLKVRVETLEPLGRRLPELEGRVRDLETEVERKDAAAVEARRSRERVEAEALRSLAQAEERSRALVLAARSRVEELQAEKAQLQSRLDELGSEAASLKVRAEALEPAGRQLPSLQARVRDLEADVARKEAARLEAERTAARVETEALASLEQAEERSRSLLLSARARTDEVLAERGRLQSRLDQLQHDHSAAKAQLDAAKNELGDLQATLSRARKTEGALRVELGDARGDLQRARARVEELETSLAAAHQELLQQEKAGAEAKAASGAATARAQELSDARLSELRDRITQLTVERDKLAADLGQSRLRLRDLEADVDKKTNALQAAAAERDNLEQRALAAVERAREQAAELAERDRERVEVLQNERARLQARLEQLTHDKRESERDRERLQQALAEAERRATEDAARREAEHSAELARRQEQRSAERDAAAEELAALGQRAVAAEQEAERLRDRLAQLDAALADSKADLAKKDDALTQLGADRERQQADALASLERARERAAELLQHARDRAARLATERGELASRVEQLEAARRDARRDREAHEAALQGLQKQLDEAHEQHEQALQAAHAAQAELHGQLAVAKEAAARATREGAELRAEAERLEAAREAAEADLGRARAQLEKQAFELEQANAERGKKLAELVELEGQRDEASGDAAAIRALLAEQGERIGYLQAENQRLAAALGPLQGKLEEAEFEVGALRADIDKKNAEISRAEAALESARQDAQRLAEELESRPAGLAERLRGRR